MEAIPYLGLTTPGVEKARKSHGQNILFEEDKSSFLYQLWEILKEPMLILLLVASTLYFFLGQWQDGIMLLVAISIVASISFYQNIKSEKALQNLKKLTEPTVQVVRDGAFHSIPIEEMVVGDVFWIGEGQTVPADGRLLQSNDLLLDESILTGESISVMKYANDFVKAGTILSSGSAWCEVTQVGVQTELGRLGKSMQGIVQEKTPLQKQIQRFVTKMTLVGLVAFLAIWGINYFESGNIISSLLFGLTIAMAMIPEEIPVAFSSFMALGAAKLSNLGILTRQPQTVESLGAATIICADKTGTITQDKMEMHSIYVPVLDHFESIGPEIKTISKEALEILYFSRLASEIKPFDEMEKAIHQSIKTIQPDFSFDGLTVVHEYPLAGKPPMMTHIYENETGEVIVSAKGAVEALLPISGLTDFQIANIKEVTKKLSSEGLRVLAVGRAKWSKNNQWPTFQSDFSWQFLGLIALYNPPKENAKEVISQFYSAGIQVKMITGDYAETAVAIAKEVNMKGAESVLTGSEILEMTEEELKNRVGSVSVFARMFPEAKLRIIRAFQSKGEVVAMTGDGVNDGPALKAADIGVAMGKRGSEIAKQAASLVLVNDDLAAMVLAISHGRKIYSNLKKAISYIVSIHIPIILTVALPLIFQWKLANIFFPIHVIFLELVMGPTCSIAFENEPSDKDLMAQNPRKATDSFLRIRELILSTLQGIAISASVLWVYYNHMISGSSIEVTRTAAFTVLVLSNIFLTLSNRSFSQSVIQTIFRPNRLLWIMLTTTFLILCATLFVPQFQLLFDFAPLTYGQIRYCLVSSLVGVFWIEIYKWRKRILIRHGQQG